MTDHTELTLEMLDIWDKELRSIPKPYGWTEHEIDVLIAAARLGVQQVSVAKNYQVRDGSYNAGGDPNG